MDYRVQKKDKQILRQYSRVIHSLVIGDHCYERGRSPSIKLLILDNLRVKAVLEKKKSTMTQSHMNE